MGIDAGPLILGLDPGRDKWGFAAMTMGGELLFSGILPAAERESFLAVLERGVCGPEDFFPWLRERRGEGGVLALVALGDGTGSGPLMEALLGRVPCLVRRVDERGTTLEARQLYWRLHRPRWWQMPLPRAMRLPPRPLDDLAAWAIAMRGAEMYNTEMAK